jgi:hypothetical protein
MPRRVKHTASFKDRPAASAQETREKATQLRLGKTQDDMLRRARCADMAAHLDDWANSPGLRPLT